mmetsp:Transcript_19980/g.51195  ORF Transcript_19980/g.51195 Transcript_19980/m.51195 type:complete len:304 (+) Transcript_19980:1327-2238(+)
MFSRRRRSSSGGPVQQEPVGRLYTCASNSTAAALAARRVSASRSMRGHIWQQCSTTAEARSRPLRHCASACQVPSAASLAMLSGFACSSSVITSRAFDCASSFHVRSASLSPSSQSLSLCAEASVSGTHAAMAFQKPGCVRSASTMRLARSLFCQSAQSTLRAAATGRGCCSYNCPASRSTAHSPSRQLRCCGGGLAESSLAALPVALGTMSEGNISRSSMLGWLPTVTCTTSATAQYSSGCALAVRRSKAAMRASRVMAVPVAFPWCRELAKLMWPVKLAEHLPRACTARTHARVSSADAGA